MRTSIYVIILDIEAESRTSEVEQYITATDAQGCGSVPKSADNLQAFSFTLQSGFSDNSFPPSPRVSSTMSSRRSIIAAGLGILVSAWAAPTNISKQCVDLEVPVSVSALIYRIDAPRVNSNIDAAEWVRNLTTWSSPKLAERIIDRKPVNATYSISGQICVPMDGEKKDILQIATHGIAFNKQ
jgi:hypothetical protein